MDDKIELFADLYREQEMISKLLNIIKRLNDTQAHRFNALFIMTYPNTFIRMKTEFEIDDRASIIYSMPNNFKVEIEEYSIYVYVPKELEDEFDMKDNPMIYILPIYDKENNNHGEEEKKREEKVEYEGDSESEAIEFLPEESQGSYKITDSD